MVREEIQAVVQEVLRDLNLSPPGPVQIDVPRDSQHGDFSTNVALTLARQAKTPPAELAARIVEALGARADLDADLTIAGPGFINFKLRGTSAVRALRELLGRGLEVARSVSGHGQTLQVEFVSANPTGPLNVVSARAAAYGSTLARLLASTGAQVECEFYVNDAGRQVGLLGRSVRSRFAERMGVEIPFPDEGYAGQYIRDLAETLPETEGRAWLELEETESCGAFGRFAVDWVLQIQRRDLDRFGVRFDRWFLESELHTRNAVQDTLELLRRGGHLFEDEGALYFRSTAYGDDKDRVVVRSDGTPTYFLSDAAYHRDKQKRGFEHAIDVWGPDHHGHIARMQAVTRALGYAVDWLEVVIIQWVKLVEGGKAVKMSKRAGQLVTLGDLLDEVGPDAAKYFFLMRHQSSHLDFDLDLARRESEENPVYYVKYAHARICSVLTKAQEAGLQVVRAGAQTGSTDGTILPEDAVLERLTGEAELALLKLLVDFPSLVGRAAEAREPHRLTSYCESVARAFHQFYHQHRVIQDDRELGLARLALCEATRRVLAGALGLLSIEAPESM